MFLVICHKINVMGLKRAYTYEKESLESNSLAYSIINFKVRNYSIQRIRVHLTNLLIYKKGHFNNY